MANHLHLKMLLMNKEKNFGTLIFCLLLDKYYIEQVQMDHTSGSWTANERETGIGIDCSDGGQDRIAVRIRSTWSLNRGTLVSCSKYPFSSEHQNQAIATIEKKVGS